MRKTFLFAAVILFVLGGSARAYRQVIDLKTLIGFGSDSSAYFINDNGQIVGAANRGGVDYRACLFNSTGCCAAKDLKTLGGLDSSANSINNSGQIVGYAGPDVVFNYCACLFDSTGGGNNKNLGTLGGYSGLAFSINDDGQIVGCADTSGPSYYLHACLFDPTEQGNNTDLGTLGGNWSEALSINNSGQIVGIATNSSDDYRACLFDSTGGGNNKNLGTLGGIYSRAHSINDSGQIVGAAHNSSGYYHACFFDSTGGGANTDLGTLGGNESGAYSINDSGQIVGAAQNSSGDYHACLFDPTGQGNNIDLNNLIDPSSGWTLQYAYSINNNGWIVGKGITPYGHNHAYLLIPELLPPPRFNLTFPLQSRNAYNARISVVFDHSMIDSYCPDDKMVAYSGEETTQKTSYSPIYIKDCNGDGIKEPLYSFSKPDGSAFLVGKVNYVGSSKEKNNFVLQYDAHPGYDYPDDLGTPVLAAANGYLSVIDENSGYVKIIHDGIGAGYETRYLHLNSHINSGWVARRQVIGEVGHKGISTGNHLHFEVRHNGIFVDPYGWEGSGIDPYTILTGAVNVRLWETSDTADAGLYLILRSPADMVVRDPAGLCISKDINQIPRAAYDEIDIDGDGDLEKRVSIIDKKVGEYFIDVIPETNALPTDTYSLEAVIEGQIMVLAQDVQVQDIPAEPYIVESKLNRSDFDNDGDVDAVDLNTFVLHWLAEDCNYPNWCQGTDLNYNGFVDFVDFAIFANNWLWEKIPADIDIDGDVDFVDYAVFANYWMNQNCAEPDWCSGADLNKSGSVDLYDLAEFADHWLEGTSP